MKTLESRNARKTRPKNINKNIRIFRDIDKLIAPFYGRYIKYAYNDIVDISSFHSPSLIITQGQLPLPLPFTTFSDAPQLFIPAH